MHRINPPPDAVITDEQLAQAYDFPDHPVWVRANMVSSLDGATRGPSGTSHDISTPADQRVFTRLRAPADVVLVGAGTVRAENYRPSVKPIAVVSAALDLPLTLRLFAERTPKNPRTIVLTTAEAAARAPEGLREVADLVACGEVAVDVTIAVAELADRGLGRIHCEGGPRLLGDLVAAGVLDELLLTIAPRLRGGPQREHIVSVAGGFHDGARWETTQVLEEDGSVFIRARRSGAQSVA